MRHAELVHADGCGYEVAVGNATAGAFGRSTPDTCPRCPADPEVVRRASRPRRRIATKCEAEVADRRER